MTVSELVADGHEDASIPSCAESEGMRERGRGLRMDLEKGIAREGVSKREKV